MTGFTYSDTPIQTHFPGDDSPLMRTNFASISSIIGVDHATFGSSPPTSQGFHNQVTFASNNVPSTSPPLPVLFTNIVNSVPQLFYYSGTAAQVANQYAPAAQGSTMLLGGIVLKWGTLTLSVLTYTFPVAFPNNCFCVIPGAGLQVNSVSISGFHLSSEPFNNQYYIAIGN